MRTSWTLVVIALAGSASCLNPGTSATSTRSVQDVPRSETAIVLWDGTTTPRFIASRSSPPLPWNGGAGWASCDSRPACQAIFGVDEGAGVEGDRGLKFHGEGAGWIGGGWNWANWRPNGARDLTPFTKLTFQIRVQAAADSARQLAGLEIALCSGSGGKASASVRVRDYQPDDVDGRWHKVIIPIAALTKAGSGSEFDLGATAELRVSVWSRSPKHFDVYLDQIAAER